jgi:Tol biopolymer transport system component/dienelactone hydrolase
LIFYDKLSCNTDESRVKRGTIPMLKEPQVDVDAVWKRRYRLALTYGSRIAKANPQRGITVTNISGVSQLYAWHVPTGRLRQLTDRPEGVRFGIIAPDGKYVYYHDDQKGNEFGHFVRVSFEGGTAEDITPNLPLYTLGGVSFSHTGNRLGFTAVTDDGFDIYCLEVGPESTLSKAVQVGQAQASPLHFTALTSGPALSHDGEIAVIDSCERTGTLNFSLIAFDVTGGREIARLSDGEESSVESVMFSPLTGDMRVLATSNRTGFNRPLLWNVRTGERVDIPLDGLEGEVIPLDWSSDGSRILLSQFTQAVQHLSVYDLTDKTLKPLRHPGGVFRGVYFGPEADIFAHWENSTQPSQLIALDHETGAKKRVLLAAGEAPQGHAWESIIFTSSHEETVQGWLGLPDGEGPFPMILETHGGPTAVQTESFAPGSQCWLDHGFAYLTINYHGSTTFGKAFEEKIRGNIGHWELEDMVEARNWLVAQGIALPEEVFVTGWSYGGYLTLFALGKRPDLWAGGMAGVAFGDYAIAYEDEAETLRAYDRGLMGGTPEEKPEQFATSSPITYAEQVTAPLFIIQGRNDTRCPPRSIEVYEARMKELGKQIEVFWFDAGHGSLQVEQKIDQQERMLRFVYHVLGGIS